MNQHKSKFFSSCHCFIHNVVKRIKLHVRKLFMFFTILTQQIVQTSNKSKVLTAVRCPSFLQRPALNVNHWQFWSRVVNKQWKVKMKIVLALVSLITLGSCAENSVSINVKNVINTISDNFISHEVKFSDLMTLFLERKSLQNLNLISPSYLKLDGFSSYVKDDNKKFKSSDVAAMFSQLKFV